MFPEPIKRLSDFDSTKWYVHGDPPFLVNDCDNLTIPQILNEGAIDRLVLASGGLARDFLAIFRRAVDVARERGEGHRGPKISSEDVNVAAGEHETSKREELKRDVLEDQ